MKFLQFLKLYEKINLSADSVINKEDLLMIMGALEVKFEGMLGNCFIHAVAEALKIMTKKNISAASLENSISRNTISGNTYHVHPDKLTSKNLKVKVRREPKAGRIPPAEEHEIELSYKMVTSTSDIKNWIAKGVPVILSVRWNAAYYVPETVWRLSSPFYSDHRMNNYEDKGASPEMMDKVKNGIMPYPSDEFIERNKGENDHTTHAILCVGYDKTEHAFIVRDFLYDTRFKSYFKIEEKCFFDSKLKSSGASMVEAAVAIEVENMKPSAIKPPPTIHS